MHGHSAEALQKLQFFGKAALKLLVIFFFCYRIMLIIEEPTVIRLHKEGV
jgi:hypothetical protein